MLYPVELGNQVIKSGYPQRSVPVPAAMLGPPFHRIRIRQLDQVNLAAFTEVQPGSWVGQLRPVVILFESEYTDVEFERPVSVLNQYAGMVKASDYTFRQVLYPPKSLIMCAPREWLLAWGAGNLTLSLALYPYASESKEFI